MKKIHYLKRKNRFITTYIIAGGFLLLILLGTVLLHLPFASATGIPVPWSDSLFTATTSVCVTGLVTVPTYTTWSVAGQIIILFLIQIGGLGMVSFTMLFITLMGRRLSLKGRQLIRDAYNLDTGRDLRNMIKRIIKGAFVVEGVGFILYCFAFVPQFGAEGIWKSLFNSVSAFCNAGIDILGPDSLAPYRDNVYINIVTMMLIIMGGLGFPVWYYFVDRIKEAKRGGPGLFSSGRSVPLYVKMVLIMTLSLILVGAALFFILEYNNPDTIGNLTLWEKINASIFQSVTTRTAGFFTIPQEGLTHSSVIVSCILMFIGGSPSGTAGGIKTTTILIFVASIISSFSDRNNTELFSRNVSRENVRKCLSVFSMSFFVLLISLLVFCAVQPGSFESCLYEVTSAVGTVGLSRDLTSSLTLAGKLVIIFTMYLGRIGPISLSLFFNSKKYVNAIQRPEENVPIG